MGTGGPDSGCGGYSDRGISAGGGTSGLLFRRDLGGAMGSSVWVLPCVPAQFLQ
jgi:hypothetical protein